MTYTESIQKQAAGADTDASNCQKKIISNINHRIRKLLLCNCAIAMSFCYIVWACSKLNNNIMVGIYKNFSFLLKTYFFKFSNSVKPTNSFFDLEYA